MAPAPENIDRARAARTSENELQRWREVTRGPALDQELIRDPAGLMLHRLKLRVEIHNVLTRLPVPWPEQAVDNVDDAVVGDCVIRHDSPAVDDSCASLTVDTNWRTRECRHLDADRPVRDQARGGCDVMFDEVRQALGIRLREQYSLEQEG